MATFDWKGGEVLAKVTAATTAAVDETISRCVDDAKEHHPQYPPASEPHQRYANRTHTQTDSIVVFDHASFDGTKVSGSWGSKNRYALYLEIGTSREASGMPRAYIRAEAGGGDPHMVPPPSQPPLMAPRPYLLPALDKEYPKLVPRIRAQL